MPEQIKAHTTSAPDSHTRYHDGDWVTVQSEADEHGAIQATCSCGNPVTIQADTVFRRRVFITCPRCGATSYNANDVREGYCGRCHDWTTP
ncbi:hypothetical protein QDA04_gp82 [Microbacterium phage Megan]|uniref:Uncharacterized protein n=1 Tax=Microbacterium phage Megan TaxID=2656551 RepID=A0A649VLD8_9CAUD|nr:hypothetical protein QDA04_gp82 [Microbacterium phage Megan]QGJ92752.1 hypothetical protein PBI_MEGAN_82 [Microbacterium phage Megan]